MTGPCRPRGRSRRGVLEVWFLLGKARHALKEYAAARDDLTRALKLNGEHVEAYHYRSHCHRHLGDTPQALADIDDAHFHDMRAWFRLALNQHRDPAGALALARRGLEL